MCSRLLSRSRFTCSPRSKIAALVSRTKSISNSVFFLLVSFDLFLFHKIIYCVICCLFVNLFLYVCSSVHFIAIFTFLTIMYCNDKYQCEEFYCTLGNIPINIYETKIHFVWRATRKKQGPSLQINSSTFTSPIHECPIFQPIFIKLTRCKIYDTI